MKEVDFEEPHKVVKEWDWHGVKQVELEFEDDTRQSYPKHEYEDWKNQKEIGRNASQDGNL